jgi:hypothetical protein
MTLVNQPLEVAAKRDQATVHAGNGLSLVAPEVVAKIGQVPHRHSAGAKRLFVRGGKPPGELSDVLAKGSAAVSRKVVGGEKMVETACLVLTDWDSAENIITRILHGLPPIIGHKSDTSAA